MNDRFKHHPPKGDATIERHQAIREAVDQLFGVIEDVVPDGREKSLAITKAEEVMFWSNASIARNQ